MQRPGVYPPFQKKVHGFHLPTIVAGHAEPIASPKQRFGDHVLIGPRWLLLPTHNMQLYSNAIERSRFYGCRMEISVVSGRKYDIFPQP